ncbi:MAG: cytochrome c3 family protein [Verrucomicrobiota bacterium JB022]|nr:cytochrome c3 family protein [Verrucomicrobiota bacterium JB022]
MAAPDKHPQAFGPSADAWLRGGAIFALVLVLASLTAVYVFGSRDGYEGFGVTHEQPIIFSHRHHAGELGIDCRYCHTGVEKAAFAGLPSTDTCLSCHSQLFRDSPMLDPLWESLRTGEPVRWQRVHDLGDFVYFDHSVHVNNGVSCRSCHGDVEDMVTVAQVEELSMLWCLECHRNPSAHLVPEAEVVNVRRQADPLQPGETFHAMRSSPFDAKRWHDVHEEVAAQQSVATYNLTDCTACHR